LKAIILAAGQGTRMGKYTENLPKGMLNFNGKTLLEWQLNTLRENGIEDISIVTGYKREAIKYEGLKYYHNPNFAITNMVETLLCARNELKGDILVSYSDIFYTHQLLEKTVKTPGDIVVAVDSAWRDYWMMRYGTTEFDLETLSVQNGKIVDLGKEIDSSKGIDYRYIGLIKFAEHSWEQVLKLYDEKKARKECWSSSGKNFLNGFMTDLLNELIQLGVEVLPCVTEREWLEFDTESDYETVLKNFKSGALTHLFETKNKLL
jgi:choline kinase